MSIATSEDDKYVTKEYLEAFMGAALQANNEMQEKTLQTQFASFMNGIDVKLGPLVDQVNSITNAINQAAQQREAPAAPARQRLDIVELAGQVKEIINAGKEAGVIPGSQPTDLDNMAMLATKIAQREAVNALKVQIRHGLKRRLIFPEEVESTLGYTLDKAGGTHEPVL